MNRALLSVLVASCFAIGCVSVPALADDEVIEGTVTVTKVDKEAKTIEIVNASGVRYTVVLDDISRGQLAPLDGKTVVIHGEFNPQKQLKVRTVEEKGSKGGNKIKKETTPKEQPKAMEK
ncbi:MAG: hypothetical protein HY291_13945 [Planctomycetes bacterium]|nr:hypothetical protein [Planctomycetota bacterium]